MDELQFGPIPWDDVSEAKFGFDSEKGRVLVDAGIATKLIETSPDKFSPWLHNSLAFNDVATTELNIYEHLWSRRTVQASSTYDQVKRSWEIKKCKSFLLQLIKSTQCAHHFSEQNFVIWVNHP